MRGLIWLFSLAAAAVALAMLGRFDDGYVLIVYPPYRVEVALLFFCVSLLVAVMVLFGLVGLVRKTLMLPDDVRAFRDRRKREHARESFSDALQAYFEGRYARAEKQAGAAHDGGAFPGLSALVGARAAHELREFARRDQWLEQAMAAGESMRAAVMVSRAELALRERDFAAAREALGTLNESGSKHVATLRLLLRTERGLGNWNEVLRISSQLAKRDAIAPALADEYRMQAQVELLGREAHDAQALERFWRKIPGPDQVHPRVALAAARNAASAGSPMLSREVIEKALAVEWSAPLTVLYGQLPDSMQSEARIAEARIRIERAEKWLLDRQEDPNLLTVLGQLCLEAELWGKAQSYLEASVSFEPSRVAFLELARLAGKLGHESEAQRYYRLAADMG